MNTVGLQNILDDFLEEHCSFYAQAHQVNHAWITRKKKLIYMPAGNGYWSRWFLQGGFCRKIQRRRPQPMCNKEVNVVHGHCPCRACNSPSSLLQGCPVIVTHLAHEKDHSLTKQLIKTS